MAINLPDSSDDVKTRVKDDIQSSLPISNPFLADSWLGALADGFSERIFDFFSSILLAISEIFPDTTTLFIDRWASFYNLTRLSGSITTGRVRFTGSNGTVVPIGTIVVDADGLRFATTELGVTGISPGLPVIGASLTQVGGLATLTLADDHNFISGDLISIDAVNNEYDSFGHTITVISSNAFTFAVDPGSPSPSAVISVTFGLSQDSINIESLDLIPQAKQFMETMTVESAIVDINDTVTILFGGINPTLAEETNEELRARTLDVIRNPVAHFNVSDIKRLAKSINQITRAFVNESSTADGQVTVFIMSDNLVNTIPGAAKVDEVKNALLLIKPANVSDSDLIVSAPTAKIQSFTFTALIPNTSTMKSAITENVKQFFASSVDVGIDVTEDSFRAAIQSTVDTITGESISSFSLSSPSGNIVVSPSEIATLGAIVYP